MNIRYILIAVLVTFQLLWLGVRYYLADREIRHAPHLIVEAEAPRGKTIVPKTAYKLSQEEYFGKSLWWNEGWLDSKFTSYADPQEGGSLAPRPCPAEGVTGAQELTLESDINLAVYWHKGEDGLHVPRFEALGSSEDVAREGELRTVAARQFYTRRGGNDPRALAEVELSFSPFSPTKYLRYYMDPHTTETLLHNTSSKDKLHYTMEIALRENHPPIVTQVYINNVPLPQAVLGMKRGIVPGTPTE